MQDTDSKVNLYQMLIEKEENFYCSLPLEHGGIY